MFATARRAVSLAVYPFLAAVYPILALYAVNLRELVPLQSLLAPVVIALAATGVVMLILRFAFGDWDRAGSLTLVIVILFFTYGTAWSAIAGDLPGGQAALLAVWGVLLVAGLLVVRALGMHRLRSMAPVLNLVLAVLLVANGVAIVRFQLSVLGDVSVGRGDVAPGGVASFNVERPPDIYWIILDRYGSEDVVREYYDHDVATFVEALRERGLYVADQATANYLKTYQNLLAARNMEYLDGEEYRARATAPDDWSPLYRDTIGSFRLLEFLRPLGYRFIYTGSHWEYTATHDEADVNYVFNAEQDEFIDVLGDSTLLQATEMLVGDAPLDWRQQYWLRTHFQWEKLHDTIGLGSPKLVHAHIALPHSPYIFEPDGRFVPKDVERARTREENYANNVEFANASTLALIDALLAADPENPPIIVIQSEEGPFPERFEAEGSGFSWTEEATDEELHEKFGIMSAFFLPGLPGDRAEEAGLYPSITLVNEFRLILNHYFGTEYELLPDRNYVWPKQNDIYQFIDATERVRRMVMRSE
jgi:hypothetical protein